MSRVRDGVTGFLLGRVPLRPAGLRCRGKARDETTFRWVPSPEGRRRAPRVRRHPRLLRKDRPESRSPPSPAIVGLCLPGPATPTAVTVAVMLRGG